MDKYKACAGFSFIVLYRKTYKTNNVEPKLIFLKSCKKIKIEYILVFIKRVCSFSFFLHQVNIIT